MSENRYDEYFSSKRLEKTFFSPIRDFRHRAMGMEKEGRDVIHLEIGEPDFDTPQTIVEASIDALENRKLTHYAPNSGYGALRDSISQLLLSKGIEADPNKEVLVTSGATEAIFDVILALVNPGDEVIILTPAFLNYVNCIHMAGGKPVAVPLREENGFQIDPLELEEAVNDKTRMVIINSPNNPTGTVLKEGVLKQIGEIVKKRNLILLSDEIYDRIVYDQVEHHSVALLPDMKKHAIVINGFSKNYAMTGWRLGYLIADERFMTSIIRVHQYVTGTAPTFLQAGLAESMLKCEDDIRRMVDSLDHRRNILLKGLETITGVSCVRPEGAFYAFINISSLGLDCHKFAHMLLEDQGLAVVPGTAFGSNGEGFVRISYATSDQRLSEGLKRLKEFVLKQESHKR
jgi:aminotransferase